MGIHLLESWKEMRLRRGRGGKKTKTGGQRKIRKRSGREQKPSQTKGSKRDRKVKLKLTLSPVNTSDIKI